MGFAASGFASNGTKTVVNITAFKALLAAMAVRARSKKELHEITGLTNTTISRWMRVLSSGKDRIVYIEYYRRLGSRGWWEAMWRMGHGMPDAVRPKAQTQADYKRNWRKAKLAKEAPSIIHTETGIIHVIGPKRV